MINFFRIIRQRLLNENKLSNYLLYAIGEIVLVVIGILIALSINNWNEDRVKRIKEKSILESIHQEFIKNKVQLDTVLVYHRRALNSCRELIKSFPIDIANDDLETITKHLNNTLYGYTFNPSQGSINNLVNTASFDIISNKELREILISWPDLVIDYQEDELNSKGVIGHLDAMMAQNFNYHFDMKDQRNNYAILETLELEYYIQLRHETLMDIFKEGTELNVLQGNLEKIIRLSGGSRAIYEKKEL